MTEQEALIVWGVLIAAASGSQRLSDDQLVLRARLIEDLDAAAAKEAAWRIARSHQWVPSVAEFREAVLGRRLPTPDEVWGEIRFLVDRRGYCSPPNPAQCSPPAWQLIRSIGWLAICDSDEAFMRAHVLRTAPAAIARYRDQLLAAPQPDGDPPAIDMPDLRLARIDQ